MGRSKSSQGDDAQVGDFGRSKSVAMRPSLPAVLVTSLVAETSQCSVGAIGDVSNLARWDGAAQPRSSEASSSAVMACKGFEESINFGDGMR